MNRRTHRLLHLSYDPVEKFMLRVPQNRLKEEDGETKRICLAPSIEDAINAKPGGAAGIRIAQERKIPLLLYVYEATIPHESLIPPVEVYKAYGVLDAIHNQEYWATEVPQFQESVFVVDHVEFSQHPLFTDLRVKHVDVHRCEEIPSFCAQSWTQALNKLLSRQYLTDFLLMQLPHFEEQLQRGRLDAAALMESLSANKEKIKASPK